MDQPTAMLWVMVFCVLFAPVSNADEVPPLVTDRPDFTESAETVPRGGFQLEFGYTFSKDGDTESHALGELLLRAAIGGRVELRVGIHSWSWEDGPDCNCDGLEDSSLGAKIKLLDALEEPGGLRPDMALIAGIGLPTGSEEFGEDDFQPGVALALAWGLTERASLSSNLGYAYISDDGENLNELAGSLAFGYGLTESVGCYLEYYQFLRTEDGFDDPGFVNGGLTWLTAENFQLDWRAGYQLAGDGSEFYTGIGASWRWFRGK